MKQHCGLNQMKNIYLHHNKIISLNIVYVKYFQLIQVGTINDGFQRNTVVMLYEAKYIDKNRVISILGKTSNQFFDKIYNKLFEQIFEPIHYKMQKLENNQ